MNNINNNNNNTGANINEEIYNAKQLLDKYNKLMNKIDDELEIIRHLKEEVKKGQTVLRELKNSTDKHSNR